MIGGYWTLTGPDTALGLDQKRAVEVAFDEIGNELIGHPIQFIAEDGLCSAEGGQAAATKLASIPNIVAVLGPDCSSSATPGAPILWNAGIVSVGTSTTAPSLTAADRKPEYFGYLRTVYSDADAGQLTQVFLRGSAVPDAGHDSRRQPLCGPAGEDSRRHVPRARRRGSRRRGGCADRRRHAPGPDRHRSQAAMPALLSDLRRCRRPGHAASARDPGAREHQGHGQQRAAGAGVPRGGGRRGGGLRVHQCGHDR